MKQVFGRILVVGALLVVGAAGATTAHRNPPAVPNAGGASKPLRLVAIIPETYPQASGLADFIRFTPNSRWLSALQTAYPPPPGSVANRAARILMVDDMPSLELQSRTVASYQEYVYAKVRAAGIGRDKARQTIFVLFIPCAAPHGMDPFGCTSHHPVLDSTRHTAAGHAESDLFTAGDSMAVVLNDASAFDGHTVAACHELAEAYTNTKGVGNWRLHSLHPDDPWEDAPPWVRETGTIEVADLAEGTDWFEVDPATHQTFKFQRIYSTYRAAHGFDDVAVPSQSQPLYNVSTAAGGWPNDWHVYTWPASISIPVTAWAEGSIGSFPVTASVATEGGDFAHPCTLTRKTWNVHDGSVFQLRVSTVDVPHFPQRAWCTIKLESARPSPTAQDDRSHIWMVGILVLGPH